MPDILVFRPLKGKLNVFWQGYELLDLEDHLQHIDAYIS